MRFQGCGSFFRGKFSLSQANGSIFFLISHLPLGLVLSSYGVRISLIFLVLQQTHIYHPYTLIQETRPTGYWEDRKYAQP